MGPVQATSQFFQVPFFQGLTGVSSGALYKNLVSKFPMEKWGEIKVSGGLQKTGDFKGLAISCQVPQPPSGVGCGGYL